MIVNIKGVWNGAVKDHNAYVEAKLNAVILKNAMSHEQYVRDVLAFVARNRPDILDPARSDFSPIIQDFHATFPPTSPDLPPAKLLLKTMFDYDKFRKAKKGWNAYQLCAKSSSKTCPYCHLACTITVLPTPDDKGMRPELDHFYAHGEFPFLALSLGNLIPCCEKCNGTSLKFKTNCYTHPHLHPQGDDESVRFVLQAEDLSKRHLPEFRAFRRRPEEYCIGVDYMSNKVKAQASVKTFKIIEQYAPFVGNAYQVAKVARKGGWIRSVAGAVGIKLQPKHYLEFDPKGDAYRGKVLGRLRRDVYEQAGA